MNKQLKYQLLNILTFFLEKIGVNTLLLAHKSMGILKYENDEISGEFFWIKTLGKYFDIQKNIIIFDVGANLGNYTERLNTTYPNATIYAFEPNPATFDSLSERYNKTEKVSCQPLGFGSKAETSVIYADANETTTEHASLYKDALQTNSHATISSFEITIETIDNFCQQNAISQIDFLKIDTEGHELAVLQGAKKMIAEQKIPIIQFEFNEMNVLSRVFLKDFYEILPNYQFYRLDSDRLIPLGAYSPKNEIFQFQNIIAIQFP